MQGYENYTKAYVLAVDWLQVEVKNFCIAAAVKIAAQD